MGICEFVYSNLRRKCHSKNGYNDTCYCRLHWKSVDGDSEMGKEQINRMEKIRERIRIRKQLRLTA